jgi:predicted metal-dependent hydrolase
MSKDPPKIDHLIRSRRKTIALIVRPDGSLEVRAPLRISKAVIQNIIIEKADWIRKHQQQAQPKNLLTHQDRFQEGAKFWYMGRLFPLKLTPGGPSKLQFENAFLLGNQALPKAEKLFTTWYREQARQILSQQVQFFAQLGGFTYKRIRISSARTSWGSCSPKGTLSFTWRLVMAPLEMVTYVIVHELVHTRVPNHKAAFWEQVAAIDPDYKRKRAWLKVNGRYFDLLVAPPV